MVGQVIIACERHVIFAYARYAVEHRVYCLRIEGRPPELNHLFFPSEYRPETGRKTAAAAGPVNKETHISGLESQQRHPFDRKGGHHDLSCFSGWKDPTVFINYLNNSEVRVEMSPRLHR